MVCTYDIVFWHDIWTVVYRLDVLTLRTSTLFVHLLRHLALRHQVWSTDLSFLTSVCCVEALESLNLSSEDIILVSEFEALRLACVCVWNGWLGHETGKRITFHPLSLDIQLEAEKWPSLWLSKGRLRFCHTHSCSIAPWHCKGHSDLSFWVCRLIALPGLS